MQEPDRKLAWSGIALAAIIAIELALFLVVGPANHSGNAGADQEAKKWIWEAIFSAAFWTAIFTGCLTVSTYFLWLATKNTATIANDSLVIGQGAFVFVEDFFFNWYWARNNPNVITTYAFRPMWRNSGATQTKGMVAHVDFELRDSPLPPNFGFSDNSAQIAPSLIGPKTMIKGGSVREFTIEELKEVKSGQKFLYLWGWARYYDIFRNTPRHVTRYCFQVAIGGDLENPGERGEGAIISYLFHKEGNCSDGECTVAGLP